LDETDTSPRSRHLPAAVRRSVHERDGDQCTFLLRNGTRCPERRSLEFHHRHPYGRGGNHDPDNVCLMCRQHNAFLAELDYGKEHMEQYRRRGDHGFEGVPLAMIAREPIAFAADAAALVPLHKPVGYRRDEHVEPKKSANFAVNCRTANRY
jgi:hypothetical protein